MPVEFLISRIGTFYIKNSNFGYQKFNGNFLSRVGIKRSRIRILDIKTSTGIFDIGNSKFSYPEFEFWISEIPPSFWISEILILDIKSSNFGYQEFEFWISKIRIFISEMIGLNVHSVCHTHALSESFGR
jgi:hypothetical protein